MYWSSLGNFLAMGGYAGFVWPAFGVTLVILFGLGLQSLARMKLAEREHAQARQEAGRDG